MKNAPINITVLYREKCFRFETYQHEYRSLMALIYDKVYIEDFGECKGIGRCGTCHIEIVEGDDSLLERKGNEITTLNKMQGVTGASRLACSMPVDTMLNGITVRVLLEDDPGLY